MHRCCVLKVGKLNCRLLGARVDFDDLYTLRLHIPVDDTVFVHRTKRFKQLFDDNYNMLFRVPLHFKHVIFQAAMLSTFL